MTCALCNGCGRISMPNPQWTSDTPRGATSTTGPHGRPYRICERCEGTGRE